MCKTEESPVITAHRVLAGLRNTDPDEKIAGNVRADELARLCRYVAMTGFRCPGCGEITGELCYDCDELFCDTCIQECPHCHENLCSLCFSSHEKDCIARER